MSEPPLSVLYVDDEPLLLDLTKTYLESLGFIVDIAESGIQALKKINDGSSDAIVSDYQMPEMNGIELLKEIRRTNQEIPFILFTGRGREEVVIEAIENGADFYLQKGGNPAPQFRELSHKIRAAVQQRKNSKALHESELRFRSLIQNSTDIIRILDKDGTIIFDSPSSSIILGYPEGSLIGLKTFDFIHPDELEQVRSDFLDVINNRNTHSPTEYRIRKADGTYIYVESVALNLIDVPGIDGIVSTTHSIQNKKMAEMEIRKMADDLSAAYEELASSEEELRQNYITLSQQEEALAKSEERFRGMAERTSDLILIYDNIQGVTYVSPSVRTIIGYDQEDLIGKTYDFAAATIFSQSGPEFMNSVHKIMNGEHINNLEIQINKKDGIIAYVSLNAVPTFQKGILSGVQVSMRDITRAKNNEIALKESEEKFRTLVNHSLDGILIHDRKGNILFSNNAALKIVGIKNPDYFIVGRNVMEFIAPESLNDALQDFKKIEQGGDEYLARYKILTVRQEERWVESIRKSIIFQNSPSILVSIRDITDRKRDEDLLLKTTTELKQIFQNMINAFIIWESVFDENGNYISFRFGYFNDAYARISKLNYENVKGKDVFEVWPETEQSWVETYGRVAITGVPFVFEMYHKPTKGLYHCNAYRPSDSPDQVCVIFEDITERTQMNKDLWRANSQLKLLNSITRHDINNEITSILLSLDVIETNLKDPTLREHFNRIQKATNAIKSQMAFTMVYKDLGSQEPQWQNLDNVISRLNVPSPLTLDYCFKGLEIYADPIFEKVFFNLLDNAIRHGDHVTKISISSIQSDNELTIVWEDNGTGIPADEKTRIFEGGFGRNTGLGLFLIREILYLTDIEIRENGEPGKGARFEILVPYGKYRYR